MNIIENTREQLHYAPFEKVDPVTMDISPAVNKEDRLEQVTVVVSALFFYLYSQNATPLEEQKLWEQKRTAHWTDFLLPAFPEDFFKKIEAYTHAGEDTIFEKIDIAATVLNGILHQELGENPAENSLKNFFAAQRSSIASYLPGALKVEQISGDSTAMDDNTGKMRGPVSSWVHTMEDFFTEE